MDRILSFSIAVIHEVPWERVIFYPFPFPPLSVHCTLNFFFSLDTLGRQHEVSITKFVSLNAFWQEAQAQSTELEEPSSRVKSFINKIPLSSENNLRAGGF